MDRPLIAVGTLSLGRRARARRSIAVFLAAIALGCGGSPAHSEEPARSEPDEAPQAPPLHTVSFAAALPPGTRTSGGLAPDGTFFCRQTYHASPPQDARLCMAQGHGITAHVLHRVGADASTSVYLERPLEVRRISDCGNRERTIRRLPRALAARLAPTLASAPRAEEIDLRAVQFASCASGDLALRMPDGVRAEVRGAVLRLSGTGALDLVRGDALVRSWTIEAGAHGLELEVLCNERFAIVSGGIVAEASDATQRDEAMPCVPSASLRAAGWTRFERIRIDLIRGEATPILLEAPAFSTDR